MKRFSAWLILLVSLAVAVVLWRRQSAREHSQDAVILQAARRYDVDPALVKAVVWRESRFDPNAVGKAGEIGLMQVTEIAGQEWSETAGVDGFGTNVLFNPLTNALAGTFYLARALKRYSNVSDPMPYALAEYNAGRARVRRWMRNGGDTNTQVFLSQMDIASTRKYIAQVMKRQEHYRLEFPSSENDSKQ